jgi:hypothetical protein
MGGTAIVESCLLLKPAYEIDQAALVGKSLTEQMQVIGHEAISVNGEFVARR